jgi:hypothetical protein
MTSHPFSLPDPNDERAIELHKDQVLSAHALVLDLIDSALEESVPKAHQFFKLVDGKVDLSVHAAWTRYLTRQFLHTKHVSVEEEDPSFDVEKISNCGLCLSLDDSQVRILKATQNGIPKATSEARRQFYSSNQLLLPFTNHKEPSSNLEVRLGLVVLWHMDANYNFSGIEVACPRKEREDGSVDCYWIARWKRDEERGVGSQSTPTPPMPDLDEIRLLRNSKKATS